jgi:hypothetical protein
MKLSLSASMHALVMLFDPAKGKINVHVSGKLCEQDLNSKWGCIQFIVAHNIMH